MRKIYNKKTGDFIMPLPLIPIILGTLAVATGGVGVAKGVKAVMDNNEANDINENAQNIIDKAQDELKTARDNTSKALTQLGNKKIDICDKHLAHFIASFEKLKNVELETSIGLEELAKFKIDKQSITDLKKVTLLATSLASGTAGGAVAGAAVGAGCHYGRRPYFAGGYSRRGQDHHGPGFFQDFGSFL